MKRHFRKVPFETKFDEGSIPLIRIFRRGGKVLAKMYRMEWFEPDGHEYTGYVDVVETNPIAADTFFSENRIPRADVALENDALWQTSWGKLREAK